MRKTCWWSLNRSVTTLLAALAVFTTTSSVRAQNLVTVACVPLETMIPANPEAMQSWQLALRNAFDQMGQSDPGLGVVMAMKTTDVNGDTCYISRVVRDLVISGDGQLIGTISELGKFGPDVEKEMITVNRTHIFDWFYRDRETGRLFGAYNMRRRAEMFGRPNASFLNLSEDPVPAAWR